MCVRDVGTDAPESYKSSNDPDDALMTLIGSIVRSGAARVPRLGRAAGVFLELPTPPYPETPRYATPSPDFGEVSVEIPVAGRERKGRLR